jgi:hypothetical protein
MKMEMTKTNNELATTQSMDMDEGKIIYTSLQCETASDKRKMYNLVFGGSNESIADHLGETIELVDVYIDEVMQENDTGASRMPRTILVDADGVAYIGVSWGIFNALKSLLKVFGDPFDWEEPIKIKFARRKCNNGYFCNTFELVD